MDVIDPILSIAKEIYSLVEKVKANKKRCGHVLERVKTLEGLVLSIKKQKAVQTDPDVKTALRELRITLVSAQDLIRKYTTANLIRRFVRAGSHGDDFSSMNERLNDAIQILSLALHVGMFEVTYKVFEQTSRQKQEEVDGKQDDAELKNMLEEYKKEHQEKMEEVTKLLEMLAKPSATDVDVRIIEPDEIKYQFPKNSLLTTPTSEVYIGEYHGFQVAIKRYTDPVNTSPRDVRKIFDKEVETMRRFESPNILRMFGFCMKDEDGPQPQFLIVMEYCEMGSLRQVLDSSRELSWTRKARMCLGAAQGLYRLHQTEKKSKVHGCINSSTFLVADGYTVKLGGFELAKTESSLKRTPKDQGIPSLCYSSPQMLGNINHTYSKQCEMYSFGIVLWEVATRETPFKGLSNEDIYQKVCKERYMEPLPEDCPESFGSLIIACRAYDHFDRPSSGVLVDKLRSVVAQLEEE